MNAILLLLILFGITVYWVGVVAELLLKLYVRHTIGRTLRRQASLRSPRSRRMATISLTQEHWYQ